MFFEPFVHMTIPINLSARSSSVAGPGMKAKKVHITSPVLFNKLEMAIALATAARQLAPGFRKTISAADLRDAMLVLADGEVKLPAVVYQEPRGKQLSPRFSLPCPDSRGR
jgi:hypothetical protein